MENMEEKVNNNQIDNKLFIEIKGKLLNCIHEIEKEMEGSSSKEYYSEIILATCSIISLYVSSLVQKDDDQFNFIMKVVNDQIIEERAFIEKKKDELRAKIIDGVFVP